MQPVVEAAPRLHAFPRRGFAGATSTARVPSRRCRPALRASTRAWCAAWTTTTTPSSSGRAAPARRARHAAAAADATSASLMATLGGKPSAGHRLRAGHRARARAAGRTRRAAAHQPDAYRASSPRRATLPRATPRLLAAALRRAGRVGDSLHAGTGRPGQHEEPVQAGGRQRRPPSRSSSARPSAGPGRWRSSRCGRPTGQQVAAHACRGALRWAHDCAQRMIHGSIPPRPSHGHTISTCRSRNKLDALQGVLEASTAT
jgi:hypothetical protein